MAAVSQQQGSTTQQELHPIAILVDELRSEDVTLRLNAVRRLSTIALALGPDRARDELIPFLHDSLDDEDEVLLALADEIGNLAQYIGGPRHAHLLLGPLESLAAVEETLVRDKVSRDPLLSSSLSHTYEQAAESINRVCTQLSPQQVEEFYNPLVKRLSSGDWFTSRTSSTALYASAYPKTSASQQDDLRRSFAALCTDETPMVRRAAAKEFGGFAKTVPKQQLIAELVPVFRKLSSDDQDSVRLLTVEALITMAEALNDDECQNYLGATMKSMVADKSWRVRYMVADHFVKVRRIPLMLRPALSPRTARRGGRTGHHPRGARLGVRTSLEGQRGRGQNSSGRSDPRCVERSRLTVVGAHSKHRLLQANRPRRHPRPHHALRPRAVNRQLSACSSRPRDADLGPGAAARERSDHRAPPPALPPTSQRRLSRCPPQHHQQAGAGQCWCTRLP